MRLQLRFLARDDTVWIYCAVLANFRTSAVRLVSVLALRALRDVLQKLALDLHAAVSAMIGCLDQTIQVVIGH